LYICATCASCGSSGSGEHISAWRLKSAVLIVKAGDHWSFRISKQMAPVWDETFGCQIFVRNFIFGGSNG